MNLANDQRLLLLGPSITSETDIDTGVETQTGTKTGKAIEPKPKRRCRRPNQLLTTRPVVTEVDDDNFEPKLRVEVLSCYDNQIGCIVRACATINDKKLKKRPNMKHSILTLLHQIFLFLGQDEIQYKDPQKDLAMKKINKCSMAKFSDALAA